MSARSISVSAADRRVLPRRTRTQQCWDAVARLTTEPGVEWILIEAKANHAEFCTPGSAKNANPTAFRAHLRMECDLPGLLSPERANELSRVSGRPRIHGKKEAGTACKFVAIGSSKVNSP